MRLTRMTRIGLIVALAALLMVPVFVGNAHAKKINLTIGSGHPLGAAIWVNRIKEFFVPEVVKRSKEAGHEVVFNQAYGGSVAKLGGTLEAIETGLLDMGNIGTVFEPTKLFLNNFCYYTPFGPTDAVQTSKLALKLYKQQPFLREVFEKKYNQKFLGAGIVTSYELLTTFPWEKIEDLKNHKIAAAGANLPWIKAAGAVPVQSNLNEGYTGFQTGVYEGWIMFADGVVGFKFHELAKHYKMVGFGAISVIVLTINLDIWNSLPPEVQKIMQEVGEEYAIDEAKAAEAKTNKAIETMKSSGVSVTELPFEEKVRWANMMPNFAQKAADEAEAKGMPGKKVLKAWIDILAEDGFKFPRKWEIK